MTDRISSHGLQIAASLHRFLEQEALPGTGVQPAAFWEGLAAIIHDLAPRNRALLAERDRLQAALDDWYARHPGPIADPAAYRAFLKDILEQRKNLRDRFNFETGDLTLPSA